jgi:hypothetical protein
MDRAKRYAWLLTFDRCCYRRFATRPRRWQADQSIRVLKTTLLKWVAGWPGSSATRRIWFVLVSDFSYPRFCPQSIGFLRLNYKLFLKTLFFYIVAPLIVPLSGYTVPLSGYTEGVYCPTFRVLSTGCFLDNLCKICYCGLSQPLLMSQSNNIGHNPTVHCIMFGT